MMDEQDKDIRRLFDEYADGLEPRPDLAQKAREKLHSRRRDSARGKRIAIIGFASLAGAAASIAVAVFAVNTLLHVADRNSHVTPPPTAFATEYDITGVRAVAVSRETASEYFDISSIEEQYNIFAENYYACYLKDSDELVYVRGSFGIETEYGTTQVGLIAEKAEFRRSDLQQTFSDIIFESARPVVARYNIDGEYISQAYFGTETTHYYVTTMGNDETVYNVVTDILR